MNKILIGILCLTLGGCSWICPKPKDVYIEVYNPPKFEMPKRPVLRSINNSKLDVSSKLDGTTTNVESDLIDLSLYASQLENVLLKIKNYKAPTEGK